jgi:hypothetical protein
MTHVLFIAAFLVLPLFGSWTWRLEVVRRLDLAGRIAIAGAAGAVSTAVVMALLSLVHVRWGIVWIVAAQLPLLYLPARKRRGSAAAVESGGRFSRGPYRPYVLPFIALTAYGALTARESAGDLHFFWGPKAIHFAEARGIEVAFLANHAHPNPDYPPLVPLVYAWCTLVAGGFSWWGAVLGTAFCLAGCVAMVRAWSGDELAALLLAATLAWTFAVGYVAGGADPPLLLFETLALCALTFRDESSRSGGAPEARTTPDVLAAIGLAGAAFTKIEGATFVIAVVIAMFLMRRGVKRTLLIAAPALLLFAGWLVFLIANHLIFGYGGAREAIHPASILPTIRLIAESALYQMYGLPWLVPLVLLAYRRRALPLLVALLTIAAAVFFYIHSADPSWWIPASAPRVLLTPLTALIIATSGAAGFSPPGRERPAA